MRILWLRIWMTIKYSWWWSYLAREHREKKLIDFTPEELDNMWDDDTIDIKNFSHMDPGPAKDRMREMLTDRRDWYFKQRLIDWADQIATALWLDEEKHVGSQG